MSLPEWRIVHFQLLSLLRACSLLVLLLTWYAKCVLGIINDEVPEG